ncbi:MAG: hypothetical protein EOM15_07770 [Spirochaetia bacterium]|nr:hypothetical protein [Spirochaetia bacterium]
MKKVLVVLMLVLVLTPSYLVSEPLKGYEPYEENEFPLWTYKLRRAETLFFGSMVLTLPAAALIWSLAQRSNMVSPASTELQNLLIQASIAATISLGIATADYIIGEIGGQ